ncbi:hypothetical protein GCM10023195_00430 [Actinoallomurus liliacearum]|uniref:Uncharacterized protein n=1 Tax=Actinoallomurus liliacearum TaxID=1080073 RepID=A0ABP8TBQ3_9ACTN
MTVSLVPQTGPVTAIGDAVRNRCAYVKARELSAAADLAANRIVQEAMASWACGNGRPRSAASSRRALRRKAACSKRSRMA